MSRELLTVKADSSVEQILKLFIHHRVTGVPVVDDQGKMVGVCSEYDVIRQVAAAKGKSNAVYSNPISFSKKVEAIQEDTPLKDIVECFITKKYRRLPVLNAKGQLVGIITRRDLMRVFFYRAHLPDLESGDGGKSK